MTNFTENQTLTPEQLLLKYPRRKLVWPAERIALERLLKIAEKDSGQSRRVADLLLAWWNAKECGGFDLVDIWGVDRAIANDMLTIIGLVARVQSYPDELGYDDDFKRLIVNWRYHLANNRK